MAPRNSPITMHDPSYSPTPPPKQQHQLQQHQQQQQQNGIRSGTSTGTSNNKERSGRSRRRDPEPGTSYDDSRIAKPSTKGAAAPMAMARREQRRRPTNYTSSYTPPASLVAHAHAARARKAQSPSRHKCSSLDRSEEDGDERQRRLKSGSSGGSGNGNNNGSGSGSGSAAAASALAGVRHHQQMLQQHQAQFQNQQRDQQQQQQPGRPSPQEQQQLKEMYQQQQEMYHSRQKKLERRDRHTTTGGGGSGGRSSSSRQLQHGGSGSNIRPGASGRRRASQEETGPDAAGGKQKQGSSFYSETSQQTQVSQHTQVSQQTHISHKSSSSSQAVSDSPRGGRKPSSASGGSSSRKTHGTSGASSRHQQSSKSSSSSSSRRRSQNSEGGGSSSNSNTQSSSSEMTEQQRIEEYAGKRALLRLEQELADHSESHAPTGDNSEIIKSVMDRKKLARVPQVKKSDLIIGEYLGRGNFCDVFEVTWTLPQQRRNSHNSNLNHLINPWSSSNQTVSTCGDDDSEQDSREGNGGRRSLEASMESLSCSNDLSLIRNEGVSRRSVSQICTNFQGPIMMNSGASSTGRTGGSSNVRNNSYRNNNSATTSSNSLRNPNVLALKCLRPAVRAQPRKFVIGAEDLAHETALLACLDHPNIIQLYGRAEGCFSTAFQMRSKGSSGQENKGKQMSNEGYFIILDKLNSTLDKRINEWKDECRLINGVIPADGGPMQLPPEGTLREHLCKRLKVAYCIADAIEYLHSRHVVFRDLKPANVGFDCNDCVKMFDFGFATSIAPLLSQPYDGYGPLTETCGTRRYMAPEVALKLGYGKEVDVYSFGMLLWEICALDKPFESIQSVDEFHDLVVLCGRRPSLNIDPLWPVSLKNMMCRCWSTDPLDRPTMVQVKSLLCNVLRDMNKAMTESRNGAGGNGRGSGGNGGGGRGSQQQRQEQGGNFIHKWRRRVSI